MSPQLHGQRGDGTGWLGVMGSSSGSGRARTHGPGGLGAPPPPSRELRLRAGRRGHPRWLGPGTAVPAAATSCSAWTKMPLSGRVPPGSLPSPPLLPRSVRWTGGAQGRSSASPSNSRVPTGARTSGSLLYPGGRCPGPGSRARSTRLCPCGRPWGPREGAPCPAGGRWGNRPGGVGVLSKVPSSSGNRPGLGFSCSRRRCRVPRTGSPGATKSAQTSCRGDAAHSAAEAGLRACLGQIVCTSASFLPLRPWARSLPLSRCQCLHLCHGQRTVSAAGGREMSPTRLCSALRPRLPQTTTCTSPASRVICTAPP